mmetsp:Transcript_73202/g.188827  ORF Transcript_73202/g.188827 Transcript_73202/m.188827 type:complete len:211 (-) Transcript_73202:381-1013(-)
MWDTSLMTCHRPALNSAQRWWRACCPASPARRSQLWRCSMSSNAMLSSSSPHHRCQSGTRSTHAGAFSRPSGTSCAPGPGWTSLEVSRSQTSSRAWRQRPSSPGPRMRTTWIRVCGGALRSASAVGRHRKLPPLPAWRGRSDPWKHLASRGHTGRRPTLRVRRQSAERQRRGWARRSSWRTACASSSRTRTSSMTRSSWLRGDGVASPTI